MRRLPSSPAGLPAGPPPSAWRSSRATFAFIAAAAWAALCAGAARAQAQESANAEGDSRASVGAAAGPTASSTLAERARRLEAVGRIEEAARAYQAAYELEADPALLYRLGICQRKLGNFALAKEAMRSYLRAAPEGALRDAAERQLAQLEVLLDDARLRAERTPRGAASGAAAAPVRKQGPGGAVHARGASAADHPATATTTVTAPAHGAASSPTASTSTSAPAQAVPPAIAAAGSPDARTETLSRGPLLSWVAEPPRAGASAALPAAGASDAARAADATRPPYMEAGEAAPVRSSPDSAAPVGPAAGFAPAHAAAPAEALQPAPSFRASARAASPWIALGAGALAAGGAALWLDGARVANDLDARFASGDLSAADRPRYARAQREGVAGRALVAAALLAGAAAVVLWW